MGQPGEDHLWNASGKLCGQDRSVRSLRKVCVTADVVSLTKDADVIQVPGIRLECLVAGLRW